MFGIQVINLPTSPIHCGHITLRSEKKSFPVISFVSFLLLTWVSGWLCAGVQGPVWWHDVQRGIQSAAGPTSPSDSRCGPTPIQWSQRTSIHRTELPRTSWWYQDTRRGCEPLRDANMKIFKDLACGWVVKFKTGKARNSSVSERPHNHVCCWNVARLLEMVSFESLGMVSYSHSIGTMAISLAVSTQCTNVTETQTGTAWQQEPHCMTTRAALYTSLGCSVGMWQKLKVIALKILSFQKIFAARWYASTTLAVMWCLSVCVSVTFVHSVKTNKHIFKIFSPSGSHTISVFLYQMACNIPTGTSLTVVLNAGWVGRNRDFQPISGFIAYAVNAAMTSCYQHNCRPIPSYRLMPAGASAINWRSSIQWCITVMVQVCLRHRKPCTSEYAKEKRT